MMSRYYEEKFYADPWSLLEFKGLTYLSHNEVQVDSQYTCILSDSCTSDSFELKTSGYLLDAISTNLG